MTKLINCVDPIPTLDNTPYFKPMLGMYTAAAGQRVCRRQVIAHFFSYPTFSARIHSAQELPYPEPLPEANAPSPE